MSFTENRRETTTVKARRAEEWLSRFIYAKESSYSLFNRLDEIEVMSQKLTTHLSLTPKGNPMSTDDRWIEYIDKKDVLKEQLLISMGEEMLTCSQVERAIKCMTNGQERLLLQRVFLNGEGLEEIAGSQSFTEDKEELYAMEFEALVKMDKILSAKGFYAVSEWE